VQPFPQIGPACISNDLVAWLQGDHPAYLRANSRGQVADAERNHMYFQNFAKLCSSEQLRSVSVEAACASDACTFASLQTCDDFRFETCKNNILRDSYPAGIKSE